MGKSVKYYNAMLYGLYVKLTLGESIFKVKIFIFILILGTIKMTNMRKAVIFLALTFVTVFAYGQESKEQKFNKETNLIEVTDYHDNGIISQEGTFNLKGQLHGEWISYDALGNKISQGSYENGLKSGKWVFWHNNTAKEVEYNNNQIASINGIKNTTRLADKN